MARRSRERSASASRSPGRTPVRPPRGRKAKAKARFLLALAAWAKAYGVNKPFTFFPKTGDTLLLAHWDAMTSSFKAERLRLEAETSSDDDEPAAAAEDVLGTQDSYSVASEVSEAASPPRAPRRRRLGRRYRVVPLPRAARHAPPTRPSGALPDPLDEGEELRPNVTVRRMMGEALPADSTGPSQDTVVGDSQVSAYDPTVGFYGRCPSMASTILACVEVPPGERSGGPVNRDNMDLRPLTQAPPTPIKGILRFTRGKK